MEVRLALGYANFYTVLGLQVAWKLADIAVDAAQQQTARQPPLSLLAALVDLRRKVSGLQAPKDLTTNTEEGQDQQPVAKKARPILDLSRFHKH